MVDLFLVFEEITMLFSIVTVPVCIPTDSVGRLCFLHTLSSVYNLQTFWWWPLWLLWGDNITVVLICFCIILSDIGNCSCAIWSPICLWRNICLDFLCIFWLGCLYYFDIESDSTKVSYWYKLRTASPCYYCFYFLGSSNIYLSKLYFLSSA